jgi:hypothetical protein
VWRLAVWTLLACKGDAPASQPPQPPGTFRIPIVSSSPPALVAVRDDAGTTWQALAPRDNGYDVPLAARFTLLVVCPHWGGSDVELRHWTREDNRDFRFACEGFDGEALADVTPVFSPSKVVQTIKSGGIREVCASTTTVCSLQAGIHDTMMLYDSDGPSPRVKIHRGLSIFDGARIDADASRGWTFERRTIEIDSSTETNNASVYVCLETESGDAIACSGQTYWRGLPTHVEQAYTHVPAAHRLPTDCDVLDAPGTRMCLRDVPHTRVELARREVAMRLDDKVLTFTLADADALSAEYRGAAKSARWSVIATRRWLADATTYAPPDVDVPGWRREWSLPTKPLVRAALVVGPKPSAHERRARVSQRLVPGDRIDTHAASIAGD